MITRTLHNLFSSVKEYDSYCYVVQMMSITVSERSMLIYIIEDDIKMSR